jgi:cytochrome P450
VDAYVEKAFAQKRTGDIEKWDGRYIFLYELTKQTDSKYKVRSELLHILLAGRDTTAALLTNVFWELSRKPAVWAKLRKEVDELRGEKPTYEQLKDMKYLKAVLNEALRFVWIPWIK